jgi:hypothetical protein
MKHLLNNLSEEEKNAIREQHAGGMKVMTENFNKLLNSKLGDAKPLVNEAAPEPEPVPTDEGDSCTALFLFEKNQHEFGAETSNRVKQFMKDCIKSSIPTIQKFHNSDNFNLPSVVSFYVGTSSSGDFKVNKEVAEKRMNYLTNLYLDVMKSFAISEDVAYKLLVQSNKTYTPSKIDRNFYDSSKVKENGAERICSIVINPITTMGRSNDEIGRLQGNLIDASSSIINSFLVDDVDEDTIVANMSKLQTYSDITDLNKALINARKGSLESFLNRELVDDAYEKSLIVRYLNDAAKRSGKGPVAKLGTNGYIAILI